MKKAIACLAGCCLVSLCTFTPLNAAVNLAENSSATGTPSPLESDSGWGAGTSKWDIVDGMRTYDTWMRGLAFTRGSGNRSAIIDFGHTVTFEQVVLWHHGQAGRTPANVSLAYWDGANWNDIAFTRVWNEIYLPAAGNANSDNYTFAAVSGSKVRWSYDAAQTVNVEGGSFDHAWLYEFEVFDRMTRIGAVPEPTAVAVWCALGTLGSLVTCVRRKKAE